MADATLKTKSCASCNKPLNAVYFYCDLEPLVNGEPPAFCPKCFDTHICWEEHPEDCATRVFDAGDVL